jgi:glucokinase
MRKKSTLSSHTIGIDLGGTKVLAALVDRDGVIVHQARKATVPPWLTEADLKKAQVMPSAKHVRDHIRYVVQAMADAAEEVYAARDGRRDRIHSLGLASAGPMDILRGTLEHPSNFKGWKIVPLVELLAEELGKRRLPTRISFQNDAIASALGEGWVGRAVGCATYAMVTVGTGIGSGVILNGRPAQSRGMGSEWGHLVAHSSGLSKDQDGLYERTIEGLASGIGLVRRAQKLGFNGNTTSALAQGAVEKNPIALRLFTEASEALASLFMGLSLGFHPEIIAVAGGMLGVREHFLPQSIALYRDLMKTHYPAFLTAVKVSKLGTEAGVIGAARLPHLD